MHVGISRVGQAGPWMVGIHAYLLLIIMIGTVISLSMFFRYSRKIRKWGASYLSATKNYQNAFVISISCMIIFIKRCHSTR